MSVGCHVTEEDVHGHSLSLSLFSALTLQCNLSWALDAYFSMLCSILSHLVHNSNVALRLYSTHTHSRTLSLFHYKSHRIIVVCDVPRPSARKKNQSHFIFLSWVARRSAGLRAFLFSLFAWLQLWRTKWIQIKTTNTSFRPYLLFNMFWERGFAGFGWAIRSMDTPSSCPAQPSPQP